MASSFRSDQLSAATAFVQESFVHIDEQIDEALAPGTARRQAYDAALTELDQGAVTPSVEWRRQYAIMLGLERLLNNNRPALADGTTLNEHQVDALSGTLVELLREAQEAPQPVISDETDETGEEDYDELDADVELNADPNADRRFWFEHATGAGKTIAAVGFVDACRTGGVLILTHRRNLVDQFTAELRDHGYADRLSRPLLNEEDQLGAVTVETYQWFVRNAGNISRAYSVVICDEAHTALGERTSACIRAWTGPVWIGMTATGALIARHVTDLFPTQTSRFDLAQAARRGVIVPLRCLRIPPGDNVRTIAKVPLRKGEIDLEFDQQLLAQILDQTPFNLAAAHFYKATFHDLPGVVYAAGVKHARNLAEAFISVGINAQAVSGETPKRQLSETLAAYERGHIQVLINAQLLAEGWNSPRATVCLHLAPTASRRVYQQRVGRVTRRAPGKEAGIVVDFVAPNARHNEPVVTLHSLLGRDFYRGGAIVVGPVRRSNRRQIRVESKIVPVTDQESRLIDIIKNEWFRIAVDQLNHQEQLLWAKYAGPQLDRDRYRGLQLDSEVMDRVSLAVITKNPQPSVRQLALEYIVRSGAPDSIELVIDHLDTAVEHEQYLAARTIFETLAKHPRADPTVSSWIWHVAEQTRKAHERYALARSAESKRLLGQVVNANGRIHMRATRRLIAAAASEDHRLRAALLAAVLVYDPESAAALKNARSQMTAENQAQLCRDLLKDLPKLQRRSRKPSKSSIVRTNKQTQAVRHARSTQPGKPPLPSIEPERSDQPTATPDPDQPTATRPPRRRARRSANKRPRQPAQPIPQPAAPS